MTLNDCRGARSFARALWPSWNQQTGGKKGSPGPNTSGSGGADFTADAFIYILAVAMAGAIILESPLCYYRVHAENLCDDQRPGSGFSAGRKCRTAIWRACFSSCPVWIPPASARGAEGALEGGFGTLGLIARWERAVARLSAERAAYHLSYAGASFGYKIFKALVLGLALMMPPRRFYQLKRWYAESGFRQYREKLGNPVMPQSIQTRRENVSVEK